VCVDWFHTVMRPAPLSSEPSESYREQHDTEYEEDNDHYAFTCKKAPFLIGFLMLVAALVMEKDKIMETLNNLIGWCGRLGPFATVMMALCIAIVTVVGIPTCPLFIGAGVVFEKLYGNVVGTGLGIASACIGVWLGSMLAFMLGRSVLKPLVQKKLEGFKTMVVANKIIEKEGWKFAFLMRLSPFLPAEVFNYACSVTTMTVAGNCLACLGSFPTTAFWVWTSASATDAASYEEDSSAQKKRLILFVGINVVVIILMVLSVRSGTKKYHEYAERIEEEEHRKILQRGKSSICHDLRRASPAHKFANAVGAVEVSIWAASKIRRQRMLTRTILGMRAVGKFKRSIKRGRRKGEPVIVRVQQGSEAKAHDEGT